MLVVARIPLELEHRFADMPATLRAPVGEAAAMGIRGDTAADQDPVLFLVPVILDEWTRLADAAVAHALEPFQTDERESVVGLEEVDVPRVTACSSPTWRPSSPDGRCARDRGGFLPPCGSSDPGQPTWISTGLLGRSLARSAVVITKASAPSTG